MPKSYEQYLKEAGNVHLAYYLQAADLLNIKYSVLVPGLLAKFENENKHWFIINTVTPLTNTPSTTIAKRKKPILTKSLPLLISPFQYKCL